MTATVGDIRESTIYKLRAYETLTPSKKRELTRLLPALLATLLKEHQDGLWSGAPPIEKVSIPMRMGFLARQGFPNTIRMVFDFHDMEYELEEYRGLLGSDFILTVTIHNWVDFRNLVTFLTELGLA